MIPKSVAEASPTKACIDCRKTKPLSDFYKHPRGRQSRCKHCDNANRARRMRGEGGSRGPNKAPDRCTICGSRWHTAVRHEVIA